MLSFYQDSKLIELDFLTAVMFFKKSGLKAPLGVGVC